MPQNKNLRILSKQERMPKVSLENVKEYVQLKGLEHDKSALELRMHKLDGLLEKFINVRTQIEILLEDTDNVDAFTDSEETEEARLQRQLSLQTRQDHENDKIIEEFENEVYRLKQLMTYLPSSSGSHTVQGPIIPAAAAQSKEKSPELKLPCFSGRMADWVTFRDTHKNLIHNDDRLSNMDKITYLRTSLTGEALQEIATIEMSAVNYQIAWEALENLYENKKMLVMTHLESLFAQEVMPQESFESLNKLVSGFEKNLQMLSKIGERSDGWSTLLQYMLCKRLHPSTLRQWE
ncbi:uncharacterized protein LOC129720062 [Wyeomyia smithii]|uniref:uncharacterized protein LOC129720062 n=1 Tax=Wyeomyia smithii TaxID=174621 RepID=UPI002467DA98|nr:uncharacterized protein LOC129720062 [Wyeomyia smithii]